MPTKYNPDATYRRPSLTTHNRLLPVPTSLEYERNLRAEVHDSLWMLSRQWQMGEFKGEDAGAPAFARVESSQMQPTVLKLDPTPNALNDFYDVKKMPLEPLVEQEMLDVTIFMRIKAGYHFRKLLKIKNLDKYYADFMNVCPLPVTELPAWDTEGVDLLKTVQDSLADGILVVEDLKTGRLNNFVKKNFPTDATALMEVATALQVWLLSTYPTFLIQNNVSNTAKPKAWELDQLEYSFAFKIGNKELRSDNYTDGQLDWQDFTWSGSADLPNAIKKAETFVPVSVRYQGMPHPRYWEMEEGRVNFGAISMSPTNALSMAFSEFGLAYSNDWFWIPMPLTINTLCRIDKLEVTSVFGDKTIYTAQSTPNSDPLSIFSLFQLSNPDSNTAEPILYLPPTLPKVQEADTPLERVHFLRDEQSNLAWAIETIVPSMTQRGVELPLSTPPKNEPTDAEGLAYRLGNVIPDNWTPFIPVRINGTSETRLQRGQMPNQPLPNGQILKDTPPRRGGYLIREEEVSRIGTIIERSWQRSRWLNGKTFTWVGRRKISGRMEISSGLAWDFVVRE